MLCNFMFVSKSNLIVTLPGHLGLYHLDRYSWWVETGGGDLQAIFTIN